MAAYDPKNPQQTRFPNAGQGRSTPTGWLQERGDVRAQELEFDNGYRVLAVQVLGQKAVIKGAGPWKDFINHNEDVISLVQEWLNGVEKEGAIHTPTEESTSRTPEAEAHHRRLFTEESMYTGPRRRRTDQPVTQAGPSRVDQLEAVVIRLATSVEEIKQAVSKGGSGGHSTVAPTTAPPSA
jgi:hypothetical protein